MSDLQNLLLSALSSDIQADIINASQNDSEDFSHLSAKFPVRVLGIAWETVPRHRCKPSPRPKPLIEVYLPNVKEFLAQFAIEASITSEEVVYLVGDCVTDLVFRMPFDILLKHAHQFLTVPQSWFVIKHDFSWCYCYSFEDDMYYGESLNSKIQFEKEHA